ncbi:hypothetical protein [Polynucleobacter sphagniphilus]|jgi:hypothetical protein|uniref:Uncharacterized protein n=1 Tax=Polynucleobacter sphagniphilus TaxID=1743169 RepID=A0AA43M7Z3_9BURK|nr:hypothetical protein [Polynucleobacter sphagniphilus]MDF9788846.1 hypothetical protein [Polynucleobacter sphagniphilus]MDH6154659.1 hypothetical protein [Polynucleobacter sphagniphilus]MDH6241362.1 hypothetical protein [Polynucleobacter sphagniphilus]MDH6250020.1 hypothetical protein [Polynucleobacter sphagniphilus]MDH6300313.1 hypothetical protein [Polynucleobacter sphagniphilus]
MRIKITKSLFMKARELAASTDEGNQPLFFMEGEYPAILTPDGKIEVISTSTIKAYFSFSQFRERISLGEFVILEA